MANLEQLNLKQGEIICATIKGFDVKFQFEYHFYFPSNGVKLTFITATKQSPKRPVLQKLKGDQA